jgi:hypothetical protein
MYIALFACEIASAGDLHDEPVKRGAPAGDGRPAGIRVRGESLIVDQPPSWRVLCEIPESLLQGRWRVSPLAVEELIPLYDCDARLEQALLVLILTNDTKWCEMETAQERRAAFVREAGTENSATRKHVSGHA